MSNKEIITLIENRQDFFGLLEVNPGLIIIDFNAEWCGPCKKIQHIVDGFFATSPDNVVCCSLNVDENFDLYSLMKKSRISNGIPFLAVYKKGNLSIIPDLSVTGADPVQLDNFFRECGRLQSKILY